jgi:hypothetical protein
VKSSTSSSRKIGFLGANEDEVIYSSKLSVTGFRAVGELSDIMLSYMQDALITIREVVSSCGSSDVKVPL